MYSKITWSRLGDAGFLPPFCSYTESRPLTSSFTVGKMGTPACKDVDVDLEQCQLHRNALLLSDTLWWLSSSLVNPNIPSGEKEEKVTWMWRMQPAALLTVPWAMHRWQWVWDMGTQFDAYCELKRCISHLVSVTPCFWNSATQNAKACSDTTGLKGFPLSLPSTQFTSTTKLLVKDNSLFKGNISWKKGFSLLVWNSFADQKHFKFIISPVLCWNAFFIHNFSPLMTKKKIDLC